MTQVDNLAASFPSISFIIHLNTPAANRKLIATIKAPTEENIPSDKHTIPLYSLMVSELSSLDTTSLMKVVVEILANCSSIRVLNGLLFPHSF